MNKDLFVKKPTSKKVILRLMINFAKFVYQENVPMIQTNNISLN